MHARSGIALRFFSDSGCPHQAVVRTSPGEGSHETLKSAEPGTKICADVQSLVTLRTSRTHSKVARGPKGVFVPITDHAIDSHSFRGCSRLLAASNLIVSAHSGCFPSRQAALAPSGSQGSSGVAQAHPLPVSNSCFPPSQDFLASSPDFGHASLPKFDFIARQA